MSGKDLNVELPVDETIEEASAQKMPVGTEADSIASVDKRILLRRLPLVKGILESKIRCQRPKQECLTQCMARWLV